MAAGTSSSATPYPIKTVVVLVQENRSFDHMLGWLKTINPEINGVTGSESNPISTSDPNSPLVFYGDNAAYVVDDPGHAIQAVYEQIFGTPWTEAALNQNSPLPVKMNGFAQNAEGIKQGMSDTVMNGFKPDSVPVFKELAANFGICDRWFASIPSSTQCNRLYLHSATSHGATSNDTKLLAEGYPQKTIFESMDEAGFSFGIYFQQVPTTFFYRNLRKLKYITKFHQFDLKFKKDCEEGKLPNYVVIEPRYYDLGSIPANDDHPLHDVAEGQKFIKQVYESLRASPQWNEILFLVTYDEHGGFYDHVSTPTGVPSPDGIVGPSPYLFNFDRLGVRVPTLFISPWIQPGTVIHGPSGPEATSEFEHSSIAATTKKLFNLKEFLTKRDAWAGTFEVVLNRTTPREDCPVTLTEPVKMRTRGLEPEEATISEFQEELVQMAAVMNGDHSKEIYPHKLIQGMKVAEAAKYVEDAFIQFREACEKARENGVDESEVILIQSNTTTSATTAPSKSFFSKMFSCLICDN